MAYTETSWENNPSTATPINAVRLNNIESGVAAAHTQLDGRLSEGQLSATIAQAVARPASITGATLHVEGTSIEAGANAINDHYYVNRLADRLGIPRPTQVLNRAQGGSNASALCYQYARGQWEPGAANGRMLIFGAGFGDALSERGATWQAHRRVYAPAVQALLRHHRAAGFRRADHASHTRDSTGSISETLPDIGGVLVVNGIKIVDQDKGFTIRLADADLPADWNGEIALSFIPWNNTAESENGDILLSIDGQPRRLTTKGMGDPRSAGNTITFSHLTERITGLSRDSVIYVMKSSGAGSAVWYHGFYIMGNARPAPIVLMQGYDLNELDGMWDIDAAGFEDIEPMNNNASLETYRATNRRIVNSPEFSDGTVTIADPTARFDRATMLHDDGVHVFNEGGDLLGEVAVEAFQMVQTYGVAS